MPGVMKRNEHKDKELEFQQKMIRFAKVGDVCHTCRAKLIGGRVFYKHTYLVPYFFFILLLLFILIQIVHQYFTGLPQNLIR